MTRLENDRSRPGGNQAASNGHAGDRDQSTAWPTRPKLSDAGERVLAHQLPATNWHQLVPSPPRIGDLTVTGQLVLKMPRTAMPWEIRRAFSSLASLPDGVTVVVKLRARQVVDLADALGGLDNLPALTLVVTGPVHQFQAVADAVTALRASAERRAAELRAVAS